MRLTAGNLFHGVGFSHVGSSIHRIGNCRKGTRMKKTILAALGLWLCLFVAACLGEEEWTLPQGVIALCEAAYALTVDNDRAQSPRRFRRWTPRTTPL